MRKPALPPRFLLRFFKWFCDPSIHPYIEGDLIELHQQRVGNKTTRWANMSFAFDVLLLFRPGIIRPSKKIQSFNHGIMFSNYFLTGIRNMLRYKAFSFINVFGLALAMSVSMLIILMIADQREYDQFHVNKDRIFRINSADRYATSPAPLGEFLKSNYSSIEDATSLTPAIGGDARYKERLAEMRGYFADPSFFRIFSFELIHGNKDRALSEPSSIVITKALADKLFGNESSLGKEVTFEDRKLPFPMRSDGIGAAAVDWGTFTVTGVIDDAKYKSHLQFDVLMSSATVPLLVADKKLDDNSNNWEGYFRTYTFAMLKSGHAKDELNKILANVVEVKYKDLHAEHVKGFKMKAQEIDDIKFDVTGNDTGVWLFREVYYILGGLALIIMLSACMNYTNLSVARALTRSKEIGVRKVTGANRTALILQFLTEALLTAFLSLSMAILFMQFIKPAFRGLWINRYLNYELKDSVEVYLYFIALTVIVGLVAGLYPAFRLSSFRPVKALKALGDPGSGKLHLYKILNVSQFVISLFFITTSILIFKQFSHYLRFNYGFNAENIINVELQGVDYEKLSNEFKAVPGVATVSASDLVPATGTNNGNEFRRLAKDDDYKFMSVLNTDENYITNLGLKIIAGKNLPSGADHSANSIVVNESVTRKLGYDHPGEIVGEVLETKWGSEQLKVVGVVENFRYMLLLNQDQIGELILRNQPAAFQYANIKISANDNMAVINKLEDKWKKIDPVHPFKYKFFEDELATTHQAIFDIVSIIGFISFLSVVIACLGLLGMATYTAERKRKEVGIRKILGADELRIAILLSKGFLRMLGIALLIGVPLSWFMNDLWLEYIPNRVEFGPATVTLAAAILMALGLITIGSQIIRASQSNPVESLKMD
jgi:putative ABC transport system permease protein